MAQVQAPQGSLEGAAKVWQEERKREEKEITLPVCMYVCMSVYILYDIVQIDMSAIFVVSKHRPGIVLDH